MENFLRSRLRSKREKTIDTYAQLISQAFIDYYTANQPKLIKKMEKLAEKGSMEMKISLYDLLPKWKRILRHCCFAITSPYTSESLYGNTEPDEVWIRVIEILRGKSTLFEDLTITHYLEYDAITIHNKYKDSETYHPYNLSDEGIRLSWT